MMTKPSKRIMLMAGELSGDMHGAYLVDAIRKQAPDCYFIGIGGKRMAAAGVEIIQDIVGKSTIGVLGNLAVLAKNLPTVVTLLKKVKRIFETFRPDVLVLIDNQGLNMYLAGVAKKYGIKIVYYIPPQEWLWGSESGGQKVAASVDKIVTILEKEYDFYNNFNIPTEYFGHPLLDIIPEQFQTDYTRNKEKRLIGLFPGSRNNEIAKLSPILKDLAAYIYQKEPDVRFVVAISDDSYAEAIRKAFAGVTFPLEFVQSGSYAVIASSQLVLGASGTLALECAILHTPMVVLYKLPALDYFFIKNIMRIAVDYISLPNIILEEMLMPEFIQENIVPEKIYAVVKLMLNSEAFAQQFETKVTQLGLKLGRPGVLAKIAASVLTT